MDWNLPFALAMYFDMIEQSDSTLLSACYELKCYDVCTTVICHPRQIGSQYGSQYGRHIGRRGGM